MSNDITHFLFELIANIKYCHFMTENYIEHKATDHLYNKINTLYDKFLETYIGKYGRKKAQTKKNINLNAYDGKIEIYIQNTIKKIDEVYKKQDNDLQSILDEIKVSLNQFVYFLHLK